MTTDDDWLDHITFFHIEPVEWKKKLREEKNELQSWAEKQIHSKKDTKQKKT